MSQIFIETVARAIGDYRFLLRRHLKQPERRQKLAQLNLKDPTLFDDAVRLYDVAWGIVRDIEQSVELPTSYYAYSGVAEFGRFLKEYLEEYEVEGDQLVHNAQRASQAIIKAIQQLALPDERLTSAAADTLTHCNTVIAQYGTEEQHDMYESALEKQLMLRREFFMPIYDHFQARLNGEGSHGEEDKLSLKEQAVG